MPSLLRVRSEWSGFSGAPGYTNLHFRDFGTGDTAGPDPDAEQAQAATAKTFLFWEAINEMMPSSVRITVDPEVDLIDVESGELVDSFSTTPQTATQGGATGPYSGASGAVINWRTNGIRNGRRVRGRTFIVPLLSGAYGNDGQLAPANRDVLVAAATALSATSGTPDLGVFARPSSATVADGVFYPVASISVPAMAAVLRSRRD